ncbi:MAG: cell division protein SepF [Candidatus Nitrosocaldaceae archaeon]
MANNNLIYVKAFSLKDSKDVDLIKDDINKGMILIIRITPLAQKNIDELRSVVDQLYDFISSIEGDIARLGEERIVVTPPSVKIWKNGNRLQ